MKKVLSRLTSSSQDQVDIEIGRLRNRSKKCGNMLRNKQNLNAVAKFQSLTDVDDKVPYETMGTVLVLVFIIFLIIVHFMIEWELSIRPEKRPESTNSCSCQS